MSAPVDPERLRRELRRMKQLLKSNPQVRARFDVDGNGVIDGHEWEAVRQLVVARLQREADEHAEAERLLREAAAPAAAPATPAAGPPPTHPFAPLPPAAPAPTAGNPYAGNAAPWEAQARVLPPEPPETPAASVADRIFRQDLPRLGQAPPAATSGLANCSAFVLQKGTLVERTTEYWTGRRFRVLDGDGAPLATLEEQASESSRYWNRGVVRTGWRDTSFLGFETAGGAAVSVGIKHHALGFEADVKVGNLSAKAYRVQAFPRFAAGIQASDADAPVGLRIPMLHPFRLDVIDGDGESLGTGHRWWSGLGSFAVPTPQTRFEVDPKRVSPAARWGLIALAVYLDVRGRG